MPDMAAGAPIAAGPSLATASAPRSRRARRFKRLLVAGDAAILALLVVTVGLALQVSHDATTARARQATESVAQALAVGIAAEIRQVDNGLITTIEQLDRPGDGPLAPERLRRIADEQRGLLPQVDVVRVTDERGTVLNGDGSATSVADRAYFQAARQSPLQLVVSEPIQGRIVQKWGLVLARGRSGPFGRFSGVVYADIPSEHFVGEFVKVPVGARGAISLRSRSLTIVARYTPLEGASNAGVGNAQVTPEQLHALGADARRGFYVSVNPLDHIERATAYQQVGDYPLLVFVGLDTQDMYRGWRREAVAIVTLATLLAAVIVGLSWFANATHDRQVRDQAALQRLNAEQHALLDNELVGMVKLRDRIATWHNKALGVLFGYSPDELAGQPARLLYADEETFERVGQAYAALDAGQSYRTQAQFRRKDGTLVWIDLSGVQLAGDESLWMLVDITAVKESEINAQRLAMQDSLTGLANRSQLGARLPHMLRDAERAGRKAAVCFLDLDGFKAVNDRHGHEAGDAVLGETARRLAACLRTNDLVARIGGDEFVIVLGGLNESSEVEIVLERILKSLSAPFALAGGAQVSIGASIGVALMPDHGHDGEALLGLADEALYAAKRGGRHRFVMHGAPPA
jgi:diguanylate cyclase (GGDEF)-like protein/PAS domain S-box-containing protein